MNTSWYADFQITTVQNILNGEVDHQHLWAAFEWHNTPEGEIYWEKQTKSRKLTRVVRARLEEMLAEYEEAHQ